MSKCRRQSGFSFSRIKWQYQHNKPPTILGRSPRPDGVKNGQGLPAKQWGRLKKLINKKIRLATLNIGTLTIGWVVHVKDANHQLLQFTPAILQWWCDYFSQISNEEFPHPPILSPEPISGPVPPVSVAEVLADIKKMKNGKATVPDDIPAEV